MDIKTSVIALKEQLFSSVKRYPLASAFAFIFTIACWVLVDDHKNVMMQKIAFASSFGFFLLSALHHWRNNSLTLGIGALLSLLYYFTIPSVFGFDTAFAGKYAVLIVSSLILLAVLPFLQKRGSNLQSWAWELNILLALISSAVFGLILYGGLAGAIKATSVLFEFSVSGKYYMYLMVAIMGLFSSHYFLSSLRLNDIDTQKAFYNRFGDFFVRYILTSIASVYALILSGYVFKILITQEWPNGILVWLSLVFASLSLATYLFWTPLGGKYRKLLIGAALVQLSLLFIAIYMRVSQYGWSADRYMVTMFGIWFGVAFVYLIVSKAPKYEFPFVLLALLLLMSQYGWKVSAYDVSGRSQADRLVRLLAENPILSTKTPKEVRCSISSAIDILAQRHNRDLLEQIMPDMIRKYDDQHGFDVKDYRGNGFADFAAKELGFSHLSQWECRQDNFNRADAGRYFDHHWDEPISISGYDSLITNKRVIQFQNERGDRPNIVTIGGKSFGGGEFDISLLVKRLMQAKEIKEKGIEDNISADHYIYSGENDKIAIRIYFEHLGISKEGVATDAFGTILVRKKEK